MPLEASAAKAEVLCCMTAAMDTIGMPALRAMVTSSWKLMPNSVFPAPTCLSAAEGSEGIWISRSMPSSAYHPLSRAT